MKALAKLRKEYGAVDIVDVAPCTEEKLAADEVLVKIRSAAICGSDIHAYEYIPSYQRFMKVPVVLGHEGAGVVTAVGNDVQSFSLGDRVMGESNIYCGRCENCRVGKTNICVSNLMRGLTVDGVMQEYVVFKEVNLHKIPTNLSFDEGAAAQACTVSTHGVLYRINIFPGDIVLVSGAGIIGLSAAQLARMRGGEVILVGTDSDEAVRLPLARKMGFNTINCEKEDVVSSLQSQYSKKADVVLECSGAAPAVITATQIVKKGGTILLLGLVGKEVPFPFANVTRDEVNIITSYTSTWIDYERTLDFLSRGTLDIKPFLSIYPLNKGVAAFEDAVNKTVMKPVIQFSTE